MRILATLFCLFCCSVTQAATVYELQPPSWLIRGGERSPLVTGTQLQAGDRVIAGKESRVELRFDGDLSLRLGNEGEAVLVDGLEPNRSGAVRGNINLVRGPARIRNGANSNRIRITVGDEALELDGRGDVAFDNESNIFSACLLRGKANITPSGKNSTPLKLAGVGRCYVRDGVKEPREVQLKSAQTKELRELTNDVVQRPTVRVGSEWAVRLISSSSEITAAKLTKRVTYAGYPVQLTITGDSKNMRFQPIIYDFISERGATQMMEELKKSYGAGFAAVIRQ
jgi:hypothetical protein